MLDRVFYPSLKDLSDLHNNFGQLYFLEITFRTVRTPECKSTDLVQYRKVCVYEIHTFLFSYIKIKSNISVIKGKNGLA